METAKDFDAYIDDYISFIDKVKTERECIKELIDIAKRAGFVKYQNGNEYVPGDKLYYEDRDKSIIFAIIGKYKTSDGVRILASHIDSPRIDLKPNPFYDDCGLSLLKTHYYGNIKQYQWLTVPLEIRGVVQLKDGSQIDITLGKGKEPKYVITDLLPHFSHSQYNKTVSEAFNSEKLNILFGSAQQDETNDSEPIWLLENVYGIKKGDFISAEMEAVPASPAMEVGIDRSMIGAYGQDDRAGVYASVISLLNTTTIPPRTTICICSDKEEIGSIGIGGAASVGLELFMLGLQNDDYGQVLRALSRSTCLSIDATPAVDPNYKEYYDLENACILGKGIGLCKYVGGRGKVGTSEASCKLVVQMRELLDSKKIRWQYCDASKADFGGGRTMAQYYSSREIDTIDIGIPVLNMHAPFELISKKDLIGVRDLCKTYIDDETVKEY